MLYLQKNTSELISEYVKSDRRLLVNSVCELSKIMKKFLSDYDYECFILEQNNPLFWSNKNLKKFYDFYLSFWNERRLSKLN